MTISNVSIPRPPDVVLIVWARNPLSPTSSRRIVETAVNGSARPCNSLLVPDNRYTRARDCLFENGFEQVFQGRRGVFGISVFVRLS
ncbi:hypothetical protein [Neobacillus massiliamazoniensis]|jgi:hypothetical protein|uniref:Uncharacterized protein n=1 Tax=Neobacillus massiliamazoniensis TaxID=1499688 RepID=A0A0U1NZS6_9BACI|nr:hypothetical protein [Neobacillus massiliamazoniensis]CRK83524.1 hypothetical protein BN000_03495 [Neobacillus massiliamazoniensis]